MTDSEERSPEDSYKFLSKYIAAAPEDTSAQYDFGLVCMELGRVDEARRAFESVVRASPDDWEAFVALGCARLDLGDTAKAVEAYERAVTISPSSPMAVYNLGVGLQISGQLTKAEEQYRQVLLLDPSYPDIYNALASCLGEQDRHHEALSVLLLIPESSRSADSYFNLGSAYYHLSEFEKSVQALQKSVDLNDEKLDSHRWLGYALVSAGRSDEAGVHLRRYIEGEFKQRGSLGEIPEIAEILEILERAEALPELVKLIRSARVQ